MAGIIVWESDGRYYCVRVWGRYYCVRVWWPVLMCESLMASIIVWESDGRY